MPRLFPLLGAFAVAVALGVAVTLAIVGRSSSVPDPVPFVPPVKPVAKAPEPVHPVVEEEPPEPEPEVVETAEPAVAPTQPVPVKKTVRRPATPKQTATPKPAEEANDAIPPGQGQLRISTSPANVASRVTVGHDDWGPAPVNQRIASGRYAVTVLLPGGKRSPEWKGAVMPDATTVLIYDIDSGRWQKH